MKSFYVSFLIYLFMLATGLPHTFAQNPNAFKHSINLKYNGSKKLNLDYWAYYKLPNKSPQYSDLKHIDIDMSGVASGSFFVELHLTGLDENYNLVLPARCIKGTSNLKLKPALSRTYALNIKKEKSVVLEYLISDEGSDVFQIGYDILPKDQQEPGDCNLNMDVDFKISNFKSPDKSACEKARNEFAQNPENTEPLRGYVNTYPGGDCAEEFRGLINVQFPLYTQIKNASEQGNCERVNYYAEIYFNRYPKGIYTDKVNLLLNKCASTAASTEEDAFWEKEKNNGTNGMKKYLANYKTNPKYKDKAKSILIGHFHNHKGADAKAAAKVFLQYFPNDSFAPEAKKLLETTPTQPQATKVNCDSAWDLAKNAKCADELRKFVAANPNCDKVAEANKLIEELSHSNFKVEKSGNKVRITAPAGQKLQWKDLSLDKRLQVSPSEGNQALEASFEGEGKYVLYVKDADCGKDTTIYLSSEFYAKMEVPKAGDNYVINIIGGQPPYSATLISPVNNKKLPIPAEFIKKDKIELTQKDLKKNYEEGVYSIEVKDSKSNVFRLKEGINNRAVNIDIVLILVVLSGVLALVLATYLLFSFLKTRKRKETIYDIQY